MAGSDVMEANIFFKSSGVLAGIPFAQGEFFYNIDFIGNLSQRYSTISTALLRGTTRSVFILNYLMYNFYDYGCRMARICHLTQAKCP